MTTFIAILFAASVIAGFVGSLVGLGGGVLIVPLLTLGFGADIRYAIGASIVSVIATSSGAALAYVRERITNLRVGMFLELGTTTGAIVGALIGAWESSSLLQLPCFGWQRPFCCLPLKTTHCTPELRWSY